MFASYLVRIYAWRTILGENGLLNSGLERLGLIDEPLGFLLYSRFSVTVALVHIYLPYVVLVLYAGFGPLAPACSRRRRTSARARPALAPGGPAARGGAGRERVPVRLRPLGGRLRDAAVPRRARRGRCSACRSRRHFNGHRRLAARRRADRSSCWPRSWPATSSPRSACGSLRLDRMRFVELTGAHASAARSPPRSRSLALVFLFVPLVVVVLFSFHKTGRSVVPVRGLLAALVPGGVLVAGVPRRRCKNSAIVARPHGGVTLRARHARRLRAQPHVRSRLRAPLALLFFLPITLPGLFLGISLLVFFARIELKLSLVTVAIAHLVYVLPVLPADRDGGARPARPGARGGGRRPGRDSVDSCSGG